MPMDWDCYIREELGIKIITVDINLVVDKKGKDPYLFFSMTYGLGDIPR